MEKQKTNYLKDIIKMINENNINIKKRIFNKKTNINIVKKIYCLILISLFLNSNFFSLSFAFENAAEHFAVGSSTAKEYDIGLNDINNTFNNENIKTESIDYKNIYENLQKKYDKVKKINTVYLVSDNKKYGLIKNNGDILFPVEFDYIDHLKSDIYLIEDKKNNKNYIYKADTGKLITLLYDDVNSKYNEKVLLTKNNKRGIYDCEKEEIIIPVKYDKISGFSNLAFITTVNDKQGLVSFNGETLYDFVSDITNVGYKYLLINDNNKYTILQPYKGELVPAVENAEYISPKIINGKYIFVKRNSKFAIILWDKDINKIKEKTPYMYDEIVNSFNYKRKKSVNPYFIAKKDGYLGLINGKTFENVTEFIYDDIKYLANEFVKVGKDNKYGFFNLKNKKTSSLKYDDIRVGKLKLIPFGANFQIKKDGKWYYTAKAKIGAKALGSGICITICGVAFIALIPVTVPFGISMLKNH